MLVVVGRVGRIDRGWSYRAWLVVSVVQWIVKCMCGRCMGMHKLKLQRVNSIELVVSSDTAHTI